MDVLFIVQLTLVVCLINLCPQFGLELLSVCNNKRATRLATPLPVRSLWPSISHRKRHCPRPVINSTTMKLYLVIPRAVLCWVRCVYINVITQTATDPNDDDDDEEYSRQAGKSRQSIQRIVLELS